jgi:flagellar hook assembly protein FlgD
MLQSASLKLKKSLAFITLALMVAATSVQGVSAFTVGSTGTTTGTTTGSGTTTTLTSSQYNSVYTPSASITNTTATILYVNTSSTSFNPSNGSLTVHYEANNSASAVLEILNSAQTAVKTFSAVNISGNVDYPVVWDGESDSAVQVPAGNYSAYLQITVGGTVVSSKQSATFAVNYGGGTTTGTVPVISGLTPSPSSFNPYSSGTTSISYSVTTSTTLTGTTVQIYDVNGNTERTFTNTTSPSSASPVSWDGKDGSGNIVPVGNYTVTVTATNSSGASTPASTSVAVTNSGGTTGNCTTTVTGVPVITSFYASPSSFNPYNQSTTLYYNLDRAANVTLTVSNTVNSSTLRTILSGACQSSGTGSYSWDGRDSSGNYVASGSYNIQLTATDSSGSATQYTYVTVNNTGYNNGNCSYNSGYSCTTGTIVTNLYVQPTTFNPANGETTTLYYNLNQQATITTQILDQNNIVVRTLVASISRYPNNSGYNNYQYNYQNTGAYGNFNYADQWNGRDINGTVVPSGNYQYRITAQGVNGQTDTQTALVQVNTNGNGSTINYPTGSTCAGYNDVPASSAYCNAIELMKDSGVFTGYSDGTFRPYEAINRAETVKVLLLSLGFPTNTNTYSMPFSDTESSAWYAPYVETAKTRGIVKGYPDGTFRPDQTINRVELLKVFLEASGVNVPYCTTAPYNDTPVTADTRWYIDYVCYAQSHNLMASQGNNDFNPSTPMTRGDVADLFYQFSNSGLYSANSNPYLNGTYNNGTYNNGVCSNGGTYINGVCTIGTYNNGICSNGGTYINGICTVGTYNNGICANGETYVNGICTTTGYYNGICSNGGSYINGICTIGTYNNGICANGETYVNGICTTTGYYNGICSNGGSYINGVCTTGYYNGSSGIVSAVSVNPTTFNPQVQSATIYYTLSQAATSVSAQILDSSNIVRRTIYSGSISYGTNQMTWDGRDSSGNILPYGTYTVQVIANSSTYGSGTNSATVYLNSNYNNGICSNGTYINGICTGSSTGTSSGIVSAVSVNPTTFNPQVQSATIYYTLSQAASSVSAQILDSSNIVRRTIYSGSISYGTNQMTWDGRDSSGNILPYGTYTVQVLANSSSYGSSGSGSAAVYLNSTGTTGTTTAYGSPMVSSLSVSPSSFNPLNQSATIYYTLSQPATSVQIQILDSYSTVRRTIYSNGEASGYSNSASWDGRDSNGNVLSVGSYNIKVLAYNSYGSSSSNTSVYINTSGSSSAYGTPQVSSVSSSLPSFHPANGVVTLYYFLGTNSASSVQINIIDGNGVIRRAISGTYNYDTTNNVTFDGRDNSGNYLPLGSYTIQVLATNSYGQGSGTGTVTIY